MNQSLQALMNQYGEEEVVARVLEQLKLLVFTDDMEVHETVKSALIDATSDIDYLSNLCEYTNLVTFAEDKVVVTTDSNQRR